MSYLFYCTHNQMCVPQYKVNVWSTWSLQLWHSSKFLDLPYISIPPARKIEIVSTIGELKSYYITRNIGMSIFHQGEKGIGKIPR